LAIARRIKLLGFPELDDLERRRIRLDNGGEANEHAVQACAAHHHAQQRAPRTLYQPQREGSVRADSVYTIGATRYTHVRGGQAGTHPRAHIPAAVKRPCADCFAGSSKQACAHLRAA
jgi:hypothetical protein